MEYESRNPKDTFDIAMQLGQNAKPGDVFCMIGDLGVGKTLFSQGFAKGLDIEDNINSPTFTILQEYEEGRIPLYHFDVYRIEESDEMEEIGYWDKIYGEGVCLIEWADIIEDIWPPHYTKITITKDLDKGFDFRKIVIESV
ncbi:MAG: tRNA (adenosine(37)-N6)-threonylcarbamoyltransferase complex ATPase subunit type 1 TsaE [Lachnospiraceae bacterium]